MRVAIIGGGAAGFFSAISAKTNHSNAEVVLFEKTDKLLAKVRISGRSLQCDPCVPWCTETGFELPTR